MKASVRKDSKHLLMADNPQAFADRVVELLESPARRAEMGQAAREFIQREWSWEKYFVDLEEMFCELAAQPRTQNARATIDTETRLSAELAAGD